jgi:hypothetical protein
VTFPPPVKEPPTQATTTDRKNQFDIRRMETPGLATIRRGAILTNEIGKNIGAER